MIVLIDTNAEFFTWQRIVL